MSEPAAMITKWLERIEAKIDRFHERSVTRDEFERYKTQSQKEHDSIKIKIETLRDRTSKREEDLRNRKEDEQIKTRLFWTGLVLTPLVSIGINILLLNAGA